MPKGHPNPLKGLSRPWDAGRKPHPEGPLIKRTFDITQKLDRLLHGAANQSQTVRIALKEYFDRRGIVDVPSECNRYTNAPCPWSKTSPIEDKCRVCEQQFPEWS